VKFQVIITFICISIQFVCLFTVFVISVLETTDTRFLFIL